MKRKGCVHYVQLTYSPVLGKWEYWRTLTPKEYTRYSPIYTGVVYSQFRKITH